MRLNKAMEYLEDAISINSIKLSESDKEYAQLLEYLIKFKIFNEAIQYIENVASIKKNNKQTKQIFNQEMLISEDLINECELIIIEILNNNVKLNKFKNKCKELQKTI